MEGAPVEADVLARDVLELDVAAVSPDSQLPLQDGMNQLGDGLVLLDPEPPEAGDGDAAAWVEGAAEGHGDVRGDDHVHVGLRLVQGLGHDPREPDQQAVQVRDVGSPNVGFQPENRHVGVSQSFKRLLAS